jgi:alanyl-tRNA synthetase
MSQVKDIGGVKLLAVKVDAADPKELRSLSDVYKEKISSGVVVLGAQTGEKVAFIVTVSKDLTSHFNAGNIMKELAKIVGGTGGGRPDMAQGGGPEVSKLSDALSAVEDLIKG